MSSRFFSPHIGLAVLALAFGFARSGAAETVARAAENQVPVTMIQVNRTPSYTEVQLQAQRALTDVCWNYSGPNAPYLLADGRRYRFLSGDAITACPSKRGYASGEVMTLRFEPMGLKVSEFSLLEGQGGENQMVQPGASTIRYWNFLHVTPQ
jgi:hypothetical protein